MLLDAARQVLPTFPESLRRRAHATCERLGSRDPARHEGHRRRRERTRCRMSDGSPGGSKPHQSLGRGSRGVSPRGGSRREGGRRVDRPGRVAVLPDCTLPGHPEVFVIGDLMSLDGLPGRRRGCDAIGPPCGADDRPAPARRGHHARVPLPRSRDDGDGLPLSGRRGSVPSASRASRAGCSGSWSTCSRSQPASRTAWPPGRLDDRVPRRGRPSARSPSSRCSLAKSPRPRRAPSAVDDPLEALKGALAQSLARLVEVVTPTISAPPFELHQPWARSRVRVSLDVGSTTFRIIPGLAEPRPAAS